MSVQVRAHRSSRRRATHPGLAVSRGGLAMRDGGIQRRGSCDLVVANAASSPQGVPKVLVEGAVNAASTIIRSFILPPVSGLIRPRSWHRRCPGREGHPVFTFDRAADQAGGMKAKN